MISNREQDTFVPVAILGAGPTGLGAAWRLSQSKSRYLLLDENVHAGGRAASFTTPEGFTFDLGGHVLFPHAHYKEFTALLDRVVPVWHSSVPVRGVWVGKVGIPTPVQRNIHRLPLVQLISCLRDLMRRQPLAEGRREVDLHTYLEAQFGVALTRAIMAPLNRKMWATDPRQLGSAWAAQRSGSKEANVPQVHVTKVIRNLLLRRDELGWTKDTRVRYPGRGGSGSIWKGISAMLPEHNKRFGLGVREVHTLARRLVLTDGSIVRYEKLVTSIPLDVLLCLMVDQPALQRLASNFRSARVQIFGFGIRGPMPAVLKDVHAFSVPDPQIPFWRVNVPTNFAPGNAPDNAQGDSWSLLCECSLSPESDTNYRAEEIESALRRMGFLTPDNRIVSTFESNLAHGYPVPFAGREALLNQVQGVLEELEIYSRGRFGGWRYEVSNQDHAFMQGVEIVDRLTKGKPETTYVKTWPSRPASSKTGRIGWPPRTKAERDEARLAASVPPRQAHAEASASRPSRYTRP